MTRTHEGLLRQNEVAAILGCSPRSVRMLAYKGLLEVAQEPNPRMGALYRAQDVLDLRAQLTVADGWLSTSGVAALFGVARRTVHGWGKAGVIPAEVHGQELRFRVSDVLSALPYPSSLRSSRRN